jgi:phosphoglycolate phosphatase-like HAD superfamily hydrolase
MIGDTWKDIQAARAAGCRAVLVDHGYENEPMPPPSDYQASDVLDAVLWCVAQ